MTTLSVSRLARRFGLSRSTLLYYDRIGLLSPSRRSAAGYRLYDEADAERLASICRYRELGLRLSEIEALLRERSRTTELLEKRLLELDQEIADRRAQQRVLARLLAHPAPSLRAVDKDAWVAIFRAAGLDDEAMWRWHREFERAAPEAHRDFLASLGLDPARIAAIRRDALREA